MRGRSEERGVWLMTEHGVTRLLWSEALILLMLLLAIALLAGEAR